MIDLPDITVLNYVLSGKLDTELDLDAIGEGLENADYDRDEFPAIRWSTGDDAPTVLAFRTGTITCTGAASKEDGRESVQNFIEALDLNIDDPDLGVENVVSQADLKQTMNLPAVAIALGLENAEYEPEQFPGLIYKISDPNVAFLVFTSGKVVVTGAKSQDDAQEGFNTLVSHLNEFDLLD